MPTSVKRSVQIKVTLTPDMHHRLQRLAHSLGQAPAAVAGIAIGEFVRTRDLQVGAQQAAIEHVTGQLLPVVERAVMEAAKAADEPEQLKLPSAPAKKARKAK